MKIGVSPEMVEAAMEVFEQRDTGEGYGISLYDIRDALPDALCAAMEKHVPTVGHPPDDLLASESKADAA